MHMNLKQELKDRLLKFETLHGLYMVPLGLVGLWVLVAHFQYILHVLCALVFMYAVIEGCRLIGYNPIKKAAAIYHKRMQYFHLFEDKPNAPPPQ